MMKNLKKAFTLVELLVVIAILAILATVSILGFSGLTKKAYESDDMTLIGQLNASVMNEKTLGTKFKTVSDVQKSLMDYGVNLTKLGTKSKNYRYSFDIVEQKFHLVKDDLELYDGEPTYVGYKQENIFYFVNGQDDFEYVVSNKPERSYYLLDAMYDNEISVGSGIDVGVNNEISSINYSNASTENNVIIKTNTFGTKLTVTGVSDTVTHYGYAGIVEVKKVAMESYNEYGIVGRIFATSQDSIGHIDVKSGATVYQIEQLGGTATKVSVDANATVYDINHQKVNEKITNNNQRFTEIAIIEVEESHADGERIQGKACVHDHTEDLVDGQHIYEVCKTCGYTVIKVGNNKKTVLNIEDENVIVPKATYDVSQLTSGDALPNDGTNGSVKLVVDNETETGYVDPAIEHTPEIDENYPVSETCVHDFGNGTIIKNATCTEEGVKKYTCSKCSETYMTSIEKIAHNFYDNKTGKLYSGEDTCSMCGKTRSYYYPNNYIVAKVNGVEYETLASALQAAPTNGELFIIKLLNDDAIKADDAVASTQNGYWEILSGQNVVIDLNGYTLKNLITAGTTSQVFLNNGTLTIMDSSDIYHNGTGSGLIFNDLNEGVIPGNWPSYNYATDVINNNGTLTINSGKLLQFADKDGYSGISFVVDNYNGTTNIYGGELRNDYASAIRIANYSAGTPVINVYGGMITGPVGVYFDMQGATVCTVNIFGGDVYAPNNKSFYLVWASQTSNYQYAYLKIYGGKITGTIDEYLKYGKTNIYGGELYGCGEYYTYYHDNPTSLNSQSQNICYLNYFDNEKAMYDYYSSYKYDILHYSVYYDVHKPLSFGVGNGYLLNENKVEKANFAIYVEVESVFYRYGYYLTYAQAQADLPSAITKYGDSSFICNIAYATVYKLAGSSVWSVNEFFDNYDDAIENDTYNAEWYAENGYEHSVIVWGEKININ